MPEVKRLRDTNEQMKRELGVEREKVSTSANRWVDWQLHESDNGYYQFTTYVTIYVAYCTIILLIMYMYVFIWIQICSGTSIYTMNIHVHTCM